MSDVSSELFKYESLLKLYYDTESRKWLEPQIVNVVDKFIEFCQTKDIMDETNTVKAMEIIYTSDDRCSLTEIEQELALSKPSLYRYRQKLVNSLRKFIEKNA